MIAAIILVVLFTALAVGAPVGFAMMIAGAAGLYARGGTALVLGVLSTTPLSATSSYELITIPMFLLMAEMVLLSGVADDLFAAAAAWIGRVPGGLAMATAIAGAGFGAICGSSTASAATLSSTSLPAMMRQGYERRMAAGVVAISGTLAMLLPTSIALVIFGLLADVSISKLLVSGIVPAIIVTAAIILTILLLIWRDPGCAPPTTRTPWRQKLRLLWSVAPMVLLFALVTGAIYTGIATPTETSAVGALGAFVLALLRGRTQPGPMLRAFRHAAYGSCMIAMILLGASIFSYAFTLTQITQNLVAWVGALPLPPVVIVGIILCGYIVLGSFMDQMAILVLTVPVVLPLIKTLGYDPVWFGVIKIVTAEVGLITPPIGLNCFIVARYAKQPVSEIFHGAFPHFLAHIVVIVLLVAFPSLILWLPNHMGAR